MSYIDRFAKVNRINYHFIEYEALTDNATKLLMLHGLTANAHAFDGLISRGLNKHYHVIAPDLRGRGLTDKPTFNYGIKHHARDILELMDYLELESVILGGHSFGGLVSAYIAAHYPDRVQQLILVDAAYEMNSKVAEMLMPVFKRLDKVFPSFDEYIAYMQAAPQNKPWDDVMRTYYHADIKRLDDGSVTPNSKLTHMIKASISVSNQPWKQIFQQIQQPTVLINGPDNYNMDEPLLPDFKAREAVSNLANGKYVRVEGNHQTMLYGKGAGQIVQAIDSFVTEYALEGEMLNAKSV